MVKIHHLYFRYRKAARPVFDGLSLTIAPGERVAVLGPSEAGKSTLALCLQGLIPRMIKGEFRGLVQVAGCDTTACRPRDLAGRVGILFQDFEAQLFSTRVDQEVAFGPENLALPREELKRRVQRSLALVGLSGLEGRDPASLSGGQKQLLALAAVLALSPNLLVLDEPTTDLDPLAVEELLAALDRLGREQDLTLVLLGEDLRLTRRCTRVVLLEQGRVAADGPPETVLRKVDLFRRLGLQAPELPALFHDLGQAELPLTLPEAEARARSLGWERKAESASTPSLTLPPQGDGEMETAPEILALRRVTFAYPGADPVLRDFSLSFRRGELTAILGPNAGGKTTLVKLLRGLLTPQAGEVCRAPEIERLGFVFQNPDYQLFAQEVGEEVAFGPRQLGLDPEEVARRVDTSLARVHLAERAGDDPFSLTKGQRQRLAVAGVLALAPQVIILDEPTTGLDFREQQDLLGLVAELHAQGHTIIMVTHSMGAAAAYARRLIVLDQGRVVLDGPPREILAQEETLARCRLRPPEVVQLSRRLGFVALTPEEFRARIARRESGAGSAGVPAGP
jgi:energy-coupling factor transport system ATP-binding protein